MHSQDVKYHIFFPKHNMEKAIMKAAGFLYLSLYPTAIQTAVKIYIDKLVCRNVEIQKCKYIDRIFYRYCLYRYIDGSRYIWININL